MTAATSTSRAVAPFTGAWIETVAPRPNQTPYRSPPSRGRGLKLARSRCRPRPGRVAPFTGAWIETRPRPAPGPAERVAPFTGAWIETPAGGRAGCHAASPPSRGRGLKHRAVAAGAD